MYIDSTGRGNGKPKSYWEVQIESLNLLLDYGDKNHPISQQVKNALSLECLKKKVYTGYVPSKKIMLEKYPDIFDGFRLRNIENFLSKDLFDKEQAEIVMRQFMGYCFERRKSKTSFIIFAEHFMKRIECLMFEYREHSDNSLKNQSNIEFFKNLTDLVQTIIYKIQK